jgi:hypothetical protein
VLTGSLLSSGKRCCTLPVFVRERTATRQLLSGQRSVFNLPSEVRSTTLLGRRGPNGYLQRVSGARLSQMSEMSRQWAGDRRRDSVRAACAVQQLFGLWAGEVRRMPRYRASLIGNMHSRAYQRWRLCLRPTLQCRWRHSQFVAGAVFNQSRNDGQSSIPSHRPNNPR